MKHCKHTQFFKIKNIVGKVNNNVVIVYILL